MPPLSIPPPAPMPASLYGPTFSACAPASATWASAWLRRATAVLIPNPFYRTAKSPVVVDASNFNFDDPASRAKTAEWTGPINQPGAIERDSTDLCRLVGCATASGQIKKIGTQGYCMGGPLVFKTAASNPQRIGAGATFHGGGLVTDKPDSPASADPQDEFAHVYRHRRQR